MWGVIVQTVKPGSSRDPLQFARHSWTVRAIDPKEAIIQALEHSTGIPITILKNMIQIKMIDYNMYLVVNKHRNSSIIARVTEKIGPINIMPLHVQILPQATPPSNEYVVTFYPATYHVGKRRI